MPRSSVVNQELLSARAACLERSRKAVESREQCQFETYLERHLERHLERSREARGK